MEVSSATLLSQLSQLGLVWWRLVSGLCRRLQQRLAKAKHLKEGARGLLCSASWPARLTSEGLFRFESLCLGGLEWFLRDNAWLEAGGTQGLNWIWAVAEQMGIRGENKREAVPSTSTGRENCRASCGQEGFLRSPAPEAAGTWWAPAEHRSSRRPADWGLSPFHRAERKAAMEADYDHGLSPELWFQERCVISSFVGCQSFPGPSSLMPSFSRCRNRAL